MVFLRWTISHPNITRNLFPVHNPYSRPNRKDGAFNPRNNSSHPASHETVPAPQPSDMDVAHIFLCLRVSLHTCYVLPEFSILFKRQDGSESVLRNLAEKCAL